MSSEIVEVNSCKRSLVAEVPAEVMNEEIQRLAQDYAQRVKVPGFRPGKVPVSLVRQRFATELRNDATQEIVQRYWKDALKNHDLRPLAEPILEQIDSSPGSPLKFKLSFEILPVLEVQNYKAMPATITDPAVTEDDVEKTLQGMRDRNAEYSPVEDREIRDSHLVTLSIDGTFQENGKTFHESDVVCVVGDPHTHDTFSENLRGARPGDKRSFDVTYPADYHRKSFAGKTLHYDTLVKDVKEKQLPELNDDFAKDHFGSESLAALRESIQNELVTKMRANAEKKAREELLNRLAESHTFDIPDCLVQDELQEHARRIASNLARQGVDVNQASIDWRKIFEEERPQAILAVRQMLVLESIANQEKLEITDQELEAEFQKLAEGSKKSAVAIRAQFEKDKRIQGFMDHLRQKKALDFIYLNATISRG